MGSMKTALVSAALLSALLLTGCDRADHPAAPAPQPSVSSSSDNEDTTGSVRPMIGVNGKLGIGLDLGGGLMMSPSGGLGFGF